MAVSLRQKWRENMNFPSDSSEKRIKVDTAVCSITRGTDKKGINIPNASHNYNSAGKKLSNVKVS